VGIKISIGSHNGDDATKDMTGVIADSCGPVMFCLQLDVVVFYFVFSFQQPVDIL
jgi:hypothetical protein